MNKLTSAFFLSTLALHCVAGADRAPKPAASPAEPTTSAPAETPALEVKTKSSFAMDESGRNPFWPVGWRPASKVTSTNANGGAEHAAQDIPTTAFMVSAITVDSGGRYAIVNGKVMTEGQIFGLQMGNQTYQLTLKAIQDGQIVLQRRDQEIVVPLHRR